MQGVAFVQVRGFREHAKEGQIGCRVADRQNYLRPLGNFGHDCLLRFGDSRIQVEVPREDSPAHSSCNTRTQPDWEGVCIGVKDLAGSS